MSYATVLRFFLINMRKCCMTTGSSLNPILPGLFLSFWAKLWWLGAFNSNKMVVRSLPLKSNCDMLVHQCVISIAHDVSVLFIYTYNLSLSLISSLSLDPGRKWRGKAYSYWPFNRGVSLASVKVLFTKSYYQNFRDSCDIRGRWKGNIMQSLYCFFF